MGSTWGYLDATKLDLTFIYCRDRFRENVSGTRTN